MMFYKETNFKETPIGKIPKDWKIVKLEDIILEAKPGFACGKRDENGILQLRMDNIETNGWINTEAGVKVPIPEDVEEYILKPGDILFNNTNSADLVGKTAIFRGEFSRCVYSNHLTRIRVNRNRSSPEWILYLFIRNWRLSVFKAMRHQHVHQAGINQEDLLRLKIPLPSLPEQRKIAEVLSTVDEAIRRTDEVIAKTERLKKGLMQTLLTRGIGHKEFKDTEIGRIPKEWKVVKLGDIGEFQYGITTSAIKENTGVKLLRITDITNGGVKWDEIPYCKITEAEFDKYRLKVGDVLFARIGATTGKTCYMDRSINGVFGSYLIRFQPLKELNTMFLYFYTQSTIYWSQVNMKKEGQLKKGLNTKMLGSLLLPLPPIEEQQKIAEILSTVDKKLELERNEKAKLERIKQGLMDLLLTGKIRVKVN